jgi:hypothetical protein
VTIAPARPAPSLADLDALDRAILAVVAEHRARTGAGPTWRELRNLLGLPQPSPLGTLIAEVWAEQPGLCYRDARREACRRSKALPDELRDRLKALRKAGWVTYDLSERSLDVGPSLRAAFTAAKQADRPCPLLAADGRRIVLVCSPRALAGVTKARAERRRNVGRPHDRRHS